MGFESLPRSFYSSQLRESALALARKSDETRHIAILTHDLAMLAMDEHRLADAEALNKESLEVAQTANAVATQADLRLAEGDHAGYRRLAHRALTMQLRADAPSVILAELLVRLSSVAIAEQPELACRLIGARDSFVESGLAIEPLSTQMRDRVIAAAEQRLGAAKVTEALAVGGRLGIFQAVELGLDQVRPA